MRICFDVLLHIRFHYSSWLLLFILQTHKSRNNYESCRSPTSTERKKWSSSWSGPGKSERSVWVVKASKVIYTTCSKFLTCCSGQRDPWSVTSSESCVVQPCCYPLQLKPAGTCAAPWGVRGDAPSLCPLAPCSDPALGGHGPSWGEVASSCACGKQRPN